MLNRISIIFSIVLSFFALNAGAQTGIVAHRGYWNCGEAGYAQNSIAALKCAQKSGFWGSEFDVNMTSDGVLLVYHDDKVEGKKIEKNPYSEFKDFKIKNGEYIPTIDQYLEQGKKYPETMLVYELKPHSSTEVEDRFIDISIAKLQEYQLLDPERVMFISFSFHICKKLAEKLPGFDVQYLGGEKKPSKVKEAGINGIDYNHNILKINKKWAKIAKRLGMSVNAWTVNNEADMRFWIGEGINQITTDHPVEIRTIMQEMKVEEL